MPASHRSWILAGAVLALGVGAFAAAMLLAYAGHSGDALDTLVFGFVLGLPFVATGALIVAHLPRHKIGWVLWAIGFCSIANELTAAWADYHEEALPLASVARAFAEVSWVPSLVLLVTLLPLLFPTGRPLSDRWRLFEWMAVVGTLLTIGAGTVYVWLQRLDPVTNDPTRDAPSALALLVIPTIALLAISTVGSIVSMVVRFRRSRGIERQQLKWFIFAIGLNLLLVVYVFGPASIFNKSFATAAAFITLAIPAAITIAILHYRLYEIDRLINRALVYGSLTALLLGAYVLLVVTLQGILDPLTSGSDLAVAGSTLAVAALFRPVRSRVQNAVDHRFYRRKYDAAHTLNTFAERLRDEIDLDTLSSELRGVVYDAVQPAHVSLWLREPRSG